MQPEHRTGLELPMPDADSAQHCERVAEHIRTHIDSAGGSISFAEFMFDALYAPGLGYYSAGAKKFGAGGDFEVVGMGGRTPGGAQQRGEGRARNADSAATDDRGARQRS